MGTYQRRTNMRSRLNIPERFNSHTGNINAQNNSEHVHDRQNQAVTSSQHFPAVANSNIGINSSAGTQPGFNHNMGISSNTGSHISFPTNQVPQQIPYQNIPNFNVNPWFAPAYNPNFGALSQTNVQNVPWLNPWSSSCTLNTN